MDISKNNARYLAFLLLLHELFIEEADSWNIIGLPRAVAEKQLLKKKDLIIAEYPEFIKPEIMPKITDLIKTQYTLDQGFIQNINE